jgi:hypothetical protein
MCFDCDLEFLTEDQAASLESNEIYEFILCRGMSVQGLDADDDWYILFERLFLEDLIILSDYDFSPMHPDEPSNTFYDH